MKAEVTTAGRALMSGAHLVDRPPCRDEQASDDGVVYKKARQQGESDCIVPAERRQNVPAVGPARPVRCKERAVACEQNRTIAFKHLTKVALRILEER